MELDLLVRGQSNAILMMEANNWAGAATLASRVEELLGLDGGSDRVNIIYNRDDPAGSTAYGASAFLGDWMTRAEDGSWQPGPDEQGLLAYIAAQGGSRAALATAVLWVHSEYDSRDDDLRPETWTSAVRTDASLVRAALGGSAAEIPYLFVSAFPFGGGGDPGHQAIRLGMEQLAADPGFNGHIAARALDIDASADERDNDYGTTDYGGPHLTPADTALLVERAARSIAEGWAGFARPGSPVALAGGEIDDLGPAVVSAARTDAQTLWVRVAHDHSASFAPLGPEAAAGIGWSVHGQGTSVAADAVAVLSPDTLQLHVSGPLPAGGVLHYGYGYGRLAAPGQPGEGNALLDQDGLPIWTPASGVAVGEGATIYSGPVASLELQFIGTDAADLVAGTDWNDFMALMAGDDAADGGGGDDVLDGGTGSGFLSGGAGDDVFFVDGRGSGAITWTTIADWRQGEQVSLWGWHPGVSTATWDEGGGAAGYRGVTLHADLDHDGTTDASVTWAGITGAQLPAPFESEGLLWFT